MNGIGHMLDPKLGALLRAQITLYPVSIVRAAMGCCKQLWLVWVASNTPACMQSRPVMCIAQVEGLFPAAACIEHMSR